MDNLIASHPTSPHLVGAGFHARPALVDGQRWYAAPTLHQPLSHGASRRDSSPFRGAEGWVEICGVYASVYHDADTHVQHSPVRGGVLDAPRSCDSRAALDAFVWRGRPHPRHPRCARHRPQLNVCNPAGAARAPFHTGEPKLSANRGRAGVEARPYGGWERCQRATGVVRYPAEGASGTPHPTVVACG